MEEVSCGEHDTLTAQLDVFEDVPVHRLCLTHTKSPIVFRNSFDHPDIQAYLGRIVSRQHPDLIHLLSGYLVTACAIRVARTYNVPIIVTLNDYWFVCPHINLIRSNGQICDGPHNALDCTRCLLSESRRYRLPERILPGMANLAWQIIARSASLKESIPLYHEVVRRESVLIELLNQADAVTIPTNSLRPRLVQAGAKDGFCLSRHGIDLEYLGIQPDTPKSESRNFRFGYLGQISFLKGVDLLVNAYRALTTNYENISLAIWGGTISQPGYAAQLNKLLERTPRATVNGRYEPTEVGELLRDTDMLVVPSRCQEIGPFVILEALAAKTPVIAARMGNMPELVEHNVNGLLFEPDSSASLQTQMRRVMDEPQLYNQLRSGIAAVRAREDEMTELMEIYSQAIEHLRNRFEKREVKNRECINAQSENRSVSP